MIERRHLLAAAPLVIAGVAGVSFFAMLRRMKTGAFDPHAIGSPMDGKKIPDFTLPAPDGGPGFSSADVTTQGKVLLVNFFASWCVPCIEEAQTLAALGSQVPIWGIAYKDKAPDTARFLSQNGNPYARLAADQTGYTAINFGLYGVPETFVIDKTGIIRARYAGALTDDQISGQLLPLVRSLA
jgi:cytochrome c biogenesis protein CcmG/thiol:disulfide interchange protein DsbE